MHDNRLCHALLLALLCVCLSLPAAAAGAGPGEPPLLTPLPGELRLAWRGAPAALGALAAGTPAQPLVTIGGLRLPAPLLTLRIAGEGPVAPRVDLLESTPWRGALPAVEPIVPRGPDGAERPALAVEPDRSLPDSPVVVLRDARVRGVRIAVLALSPVFAQNGAPRAVTELRAAIPGAAPLAEGAATLLATRRPFLADAPGPSNPAAGKGWRVRVARAGIQRLTRAALLAAGVPLGATTSPHLYYQGVELPLEQRGAAASLELRFYAPRPGDRWNAGDTYWLTVEGRAGLPMAHRTVTPAGAPQRGDAREQGLWRDNKLYDAGNPGLDGDHWYAAELKTGPGLGPATLSVPLTSTLGLVGGTTVLTATGVAYTSGQHSLAITIGGERRSAIWSGRGVWTQALTFTTNLDAAEIELTPGGTIDDISLDSLAWDRPVDLDAHGKGATFGGLPGAWQYRLRRAPAGHNADDLYDVGDPRAPSILTIAGGADVAFEDGPAPRRYVLAGPGTLWEPALSRGQTFDFATRGDAIYIAPAQFHAALAPLVALRQSQGYSVRLIDAQAIYDSWSFGQVSPQAIHAFLRYAAAAWSPPPDAVTLVGDGTSDPLNYTGRNNTTFIPPYLAMVDPWLGETACDSCYARLDSADPLADDLADLAFGRLPVKSAAELAALAAKIVAYETGPLDPSWRSRSLYFADDADEAGDFAAFADISVAQQPARVQVQRMYYDPLSAGLPWREPDPARARRRVIDGLSAGAGLVNYVGHSSPYQWATTDRNLAQPYLLGLYDVDGLANGASQPIVLEMTCLTGAFQTPAYSGTTIDERLVLQPNGGAIAVWGPTGQGVAHGHDALQRGFYQALWSAPPLSATIGQLTAAGAIELFQNGLCCQDSLSTYALLGDPLTRARVLPARRVYLPASWR
ncbi:MAG: hypothetical protein IPO81_09745 [Kouleothrix sp.]|nr:hypothetical protein [Kouleothrix sp.]